MEDALRLMIENSENARRIASRKNINVPAGIAGELVVELERRLILGFYKTGEHLSFNMLADTFKVSRQPVSAAIGHLRASGYVEVLPQVGCRVVHPSREEVVDFFRVHGAIEAIAVELAVERKTEAEALQFAAIQPPPIAKLDGIEQRAAYISYIDSFHEQIWAMAKAPMLEGQFKGFRNLASFYLWQGIQQLAEPAAEKLNDQRRKIAEAIIAGDKSGAARLMRQHVTNKPKLVFP